MTSHMEGEAGGHFCQLLCEVVSKKNFLAWHRGGRGGLENLRFIVMSFIDVFLAAFFVLDAPYWSVADLKATI